MSLNTGIVLSEEEKAKVLAAFNDIRNTPVMMVGGVDFVQSATKRAYELMQGYAKSHGLPDGSFYYSMLPDGRIHVPDGYEEEFTRLSTRAP